MYRLGRRAIIAAGRSPAARRARALGTSIVGAAGKAAYSGVKRAYKYVKGSKRSKPRKGTGWGKRARKSALIGNRKAAKKIDNEGLGKRIAKLENKVGEEPSVMSYFTNYAYSQTTTPGASTVGQYVIMDKATLTGVAQQAKFLDTAVPATPKTINIFATGAESTVHFSQHATFHLQNTYAVPVQAEYCVYQCKRSTNDGPIELMTKGLVDLGSLIARSDIDAPVWEIPLVSDYYKKKLYKKVYLKPGEWKKFSINVPKFAYDPEDDVQDGKTYSVVAKATLVVVRLTGVVGHQPGTAATVNNLAGAVDLKYELRTKLHYMSGISGYKYWYRGPTQGVIPTHNIYTDDVAAETYAI